MRVGSKRKTCVNIGLRHHVGLKNVYTTTRSNLNTSKKKDRLCKRFTRAHEFESFYSRRTSSFERIVEIESGFLLLLWYQLCR